MIYLFLTNHSLQIFTKTKQLTLPFPDEVIHFQEIVDRKKFETLLKSFFEKIKGTEALLFLSEDILFQKILEKTPQLVEEEEAKTFFAKVPFQQDFLAKKIVHLKKEIIFLACHRDYFQTIVHITTLYGWEIRKIIPLSIFRSITQGKPISFSLLTNTLKNKVLLEEVDFFQEYAPAEDKDSIEQEEESFPEEDVMGKKLTIKFNMKAQYIVAVICLIFFGGSLVYAYPIMFPAASSEKIIPTPTVRPVITIFPSPTSSPQTLSSKEDLKISILNGSGITGQATSIKDLLSSDGFTNMEVGNAAEKGVTASTVIFGPHVSDSLQAEVVGLLKKDLATVESQKVASSDLFDIIITTGNGFSTQK